LASTNEILQLSAMSVLLLKHSFFECISGYISAFLSVENCGSHYWKETWNPLL